jgi:phosphatidylserine decarboxylase
MARRIGGWLPQDPLEIQKHLKETLRRAKDANMPTAPPIQALQNLLNTNAVVYMLFNEMLSEVPTVWPYNQIPGGPPNSEIRTVEELLTVLNYQIQLPIMYNDSAQIGTPINAILDWPMATKAGFSAFTRHDVNMIFRDMLKFWGEFLKSPDSVATVTTAQTPTVQGWLSPTAQSQEPGLANFLQTYQVPNPNDTIHYGFTSWNQFFTREFKQGLRPLAGPGNDNLIVSATESTPFYIQRNVQLRDTFWVKNKDGRSNYSLADMLGDANLAEQFVGGTVYQAFLSADSYHNWHAPVSGRYVSKPRIIQGTYYSEPLMWSFSPDSGPPEPDVGSDALSQGYISSVATRGVAIIQPDNPRIGPMAIIMIGMAEVSSVNFFDKETFDKGELIGQFQFGGSTHCIIFGPGVQPKFAADAIPSVNVTEPGAPVKVKSELCTIE